MKRLLRIIGALAVLGILSLPIVPAMAAAPPTVTSDSVSVSISRLEDNGLAGWFHGTLTDMGGAASVTVSYEWGPTNAYGNTSTTLVMTSIGSFDILLSTDETKLHAGTHYHWRAKGVNITGASTGADIVQDMPLKEAVAPYDAYQAQSAVGDILITTAPAVIPNMYTEGETGGLFGLGPLIDPALTVAGIPKGMFWYPIAFVVAIGLGFGAYSLTRQLIIQAIVSGCIMALFCGGGILGTGLLPYWTVLIFAVEAIMLVMIEQRQHV